MYDPAIMKELDPLSRRLLLHWLR